VLTMEEYQQLAGRTANSGIDDKRRIVAALGLAGETGEFVDMIKKIVAHGHDVSDEKLKEELGDVLWYIAETCSAFGWKMDEVASANIEKLKARYPDGFSEKASRDRVA
jgi:NTP pyrophosphatase (non-canonical NTP hydrolase)